MTKNELKNIILEKLDRDKDALIRISNNQLKEIQEKGQNKNRLEKLHHTNGQICYINQITTYVEYYINNGQ